MPDRSHGYDELAETFIRSRYAPIGEGVVRAWAQEFPPHAEVLELGCGHGVVSSVLIEAGLTLSVIDASPRLLEAFRDRFPAVETQCAPAEESNFFGRTFDGVIAIGLLFLLDEDAQMTFLRKAGRALRPNGRLLFTAPHQDVGWTDIMTGQRSRSLGAPVYEQVLREEGLQTRWGVTDEAQNHYFFATKAAESLE